MSVAGDILLDVQHVSVVYDSAGGEVFAVNDVNLTLRRGEILGLAGESGSAAGQEARSVSGPVSGGAGGKARTHGAPRGAARAHGAADGAGA